MSNLEDSGGSAPPPLQNPAKRAFVVQFEPVEGVRRRLRGRVELVASGEVARFRSIKQLVGFLVGTLRRGEGAAAGGGLVESTEPSPLVEGSKHQGRSRS